MTKDYPWGKGTPTWVQDATANNSDKSFTVPVGKVWKLLSIHAEITCSAKVGSRNLAVSTTNGADLINIQGRTGGIGAAQVGVLNIFAGGAFYTAAASYNPTLAGATPNVAFGASYQPDILLPAGYVIRVYDTGAVDVAADDLTVVLHYVEYDA